MENGVLTTLKPSFFTQNEKKIEKKFIFFLPV